MLVKKIAGSDWKPSENPGIQVGETMDVTDPKQLILDKKVVAVGSNGEELDSFDLYGVVDEDLVKELKEFKNKQHQEQIKKELESEKEVLTKALEEAKAKNAKIEAKKDIQSMAWKELRQKAIDAGFFKPKMDKKEIIKELIKRLD